MLRALIRLSSLAVLVFLNQPAQSQSKIVEQPPNTAMSGRVIDEDGIPVNGAEITLQHYQPVKGRSQKITTAPNGSFTITELPSGDYASCVTVPKSDYVDDCLWGLNFLPKIIPAVATAPGQAAKAPQLITDVPYGSAKLALAATSANANQQLTVRKGARLVFQFPDPNKVIDKNTHLVVGALGPGNLMIPATQTPGGTLTYELLIPFDTAVNVMISSLDLQATGPNGPVNFQTGYFAPFKVTRTTRTPITTTFTISWKKGK